MTKRKTELETKTEENAANVGEIRELDLLHGDDLLATDALRAAKVVTPEWKSDSFVYVAELSGDERDDLEVQWAEYKEGTDDPDSNVGFRAFAVAYCLCDKHRFRIYTDRAVEVAQKLGKRNAKALSRAFSCISRMNGLTKADIDDLEKN